MRKSINSIEINNVCFGYSGFPSVVENLNWRIQSPAVMSVGGARGAGKSSLARMIAGLITPTTGQIKYNNEIVSEMSFEEFLGYRHNVGYSFDYGGLINNKTLYENLQLPLQYHRWLEPKELHERVMFWIQNFNLTAGKDERPFSVSGGMRKEACVARAFVMEPETIILDDPITGLNPGSVRFLKSYLKEKVEKREIKLVLVFSEDTQLIDGLDASLWKLKEGGLVFAGGTKLAGVA